MRTWFAPAGRAATPEEAAQLTAARETALQQIIQGVIVVAFLAVVTNAVSALPYGDWSSTLLYGVLFVALVGLALGRRLPFRLRSGIFISLLYGLALVSLVSLGLSGAGRVYLIAFAVIATAVYGYRAGLAAAGLSLLTWFVVAALFSAGRLTQSSPNDQALLINWIAAGVSTLLVMVALMIPQRQFLDIRRGAVSSSQQNAELEAGRVKLAAQAAQLETASREAQAARAEQASQSAALQRRAALLGLNAEVARAASGLRDPAELLQTAANLISQRFDFYHAGIFLLDDAREWAVLRAANSAGGQRMLARGHRLAVGREGIVGYVTGTGQPRIALDVGADAVHFINPDLPETHSEMAVPLRVREEIIGALDVQSVQVNAFTHEDAGVLQSLADQIALAIDNARLFQETQQRVAELQAVQREARAAGGLGGPERATAFRYDGVDVTTLIEAPALANDKGTSALAPRDQLTIPLKFGDQALGSLELRRAGEAWTSDDLDLSSAVADRMALALESAQLFQQTRARAQQLATLSEVTIGLTGPQLNTQQAMEQICRGALLLFEIESAGIWLPAGTDEVELRVSLNAGQRSLAGRRVKVGEGLAGAVFATNQALRVDDYPHWSGAAEWADAPFQAALAVPMLWQGTALGVLMLAHSQPERKFTPDEERIAQLYASQSAATLENARLVAETQQRLTELGAINSISQALATRLELNSLLKLVGDQVFGIFGVRNGFVALYDSRTKTMEFPYFLEAGEPQVVAPRPLGQGLTSVVINTRRPLLINHDAAQRSAELGAYLQGAPAKSWLGVPIPSADDVIGVLSVQDTEREGLFGEADIRLLSTIAANVGVAIRNARLFQETQRRAEQLATAAEIARVMTASLDRDELLRTAVNLIRERFGFYHASVFTVEPGAGMAVLRESTGEAGRQLKARHHQLAVGSRSLVGAATASRQPVVVQDVIDDPTHLRNPLLPDTRAEAVIPLLSGESVVGALDVQSTLPQAFGTDDIAILVTIADQLAVALQNARLFDQTSRQARRERLVVDITGKIRAAGDMDAMLRTAVSELRQALGARQGAVRLHLPGMPVQPAAGASTAAAANAAPPASGAPHTTGNGNGSHGANGSKSADSGPKDQSGPKGAGG